MSFFFKKISLITKCIVSLTLLVSCAVPRGGVIDNKVICPLDEDVYLYNKVFLQGNVLGEIPMETHWSNVKLGRGYCRLEGAVFATSSKEPIPLQHTAFYLIQYDGEKKTAHLKDDGKKKEYGIGQYVIIEKLDVREKKGQFRIHINRKKLEKYFLAIYVPGGKTIIYKIRQK